MFYPLRVIMTIPGVPPADPELATGVAGAEARLATKKAFLLNLERRSPRDDVASVIATAEIDGGPIGEVEAISYYIIIASAGHDATTATMAD